MREREGMFMRDLWRHMDGTSSVAAYVNLKRKRGEGGGAGGALVGRWLPKLACLLDVTEPSCWFCTH